MSKANLALLVVCTLFLSSCGLVLDKALEAGDYGEECTTQDDCKEGLLCVQAVEVDPGQDASRGYRCMQACQKASQCTQSSYHVSCCKMSFKQESFTACFDAEEALCTQVVEESAP